MSEMLKSGGITYSRSYSRVLYIWYAILMSLRSYIIEFTTAQIYCKDSIPFLDINYPIFMTFPLPRTFIFFLSLCIPLSDNHHPYLCTMFYNNLWWNAPFYCYTTFLNYSLLRVIYWWNVFDNFLVFFFFIFSLFITLCICAKTNLFLFCFILLIHPILFIVLFIWH